MHDRQRATFLRRALARLVPSRRRACRTRGARATLPTDAKPTCAVSQSTFNTWFQSGGAANNGVVNPANGINFPNTPNCSFYQWAAQMFLWLTSPAPAVYGGGAHIFDSQSFFDLSTADAQGNRTLEAHTAGFIRPLAVRAAKLGPDQLPIAFTREGTPVQILPAQTIAGPLRLLDATGAFVEVTRAARADEALCNCSPRPARKCSPASATLRCRRLRRNAPPRQRRRPRLRSPTSLRPRISRRTRTR